MLFITHPESFSFGTSHAKPGSDVTHLQKRINFLRNMMELFDIIANIWPKPAVLNRIATMDAELKTLLNHQKVLLNHFV
jgi:hypothetical protein